LDCSSPFQRSNSAGRLAHVDGRGAAISTSKPTESGAMPTNQCIGFDDCKGVPPVEKTRELGKGKANGVGGTPRLYLSLSVEAKLFSKEQILGGKSGRRPEHKKRNVAISAKIKMLLRANVNTARELRADDGIQVLYRTLKRCVLGRVRNIAEHRGEPTNPGRYRN
jgi:hypothetical protein